MSPLAWRCRPPTARSACRSRWSPWSRTPTSRCVVETADVADDHDGPAPFSITIVDGGEAVESYDDLTLGGPRDAATVINKTSTRVKVEVKLADDVDLSSQLELLKPGAYALEKAAAKPVPVNGRKFAGSESARTGINGLAIAEDVTIVLVPDLVTAATKDGRHRSTWACGRPCRRA